MNWLNRRKISSNTKLSRNKWTCFLILLLLSSLLKELLYWYHQFSFFRIFGRSAIQMSSSPSNLNPLPPSIIESAWCERPIFANDHLPYISCSILFVKMASLQDARFFFILGVSVFACLSVSVCVCECVSMCLCVCLYVWVSVSLSICIVFLYSLIKVDTFLFMSVCISVFSAWKVKKIYKCQDLEMSQENFPVRFSRKSISFWERRSRAPRDYDSLLSSNPL